MIQIFKTKSYAMYCKLKSYSRAEEESFLFLFLESVFHFLLKKGSRRCTLLRRILKAIQSSLTGNFCSTLFRKSPKEELQRNVFPNCRFLLWKDDKTGCVDSLQAKNTRNNTFKANVEPVKNFFYVCSGWEVNMQTSGQFSRNFQVNLEEIYT